MALVGLAGLCGTGKTTAINYLHELSGGEIVYLGKIILDQLALQGLPNTPEQERFMQQRLREQHGDTILAELAGPTVRGHLAEGKHVLIDAVYLRAEYEALVGYCGDCTSIVIATHACFSTRVGRMAQRKERPYSAEQLRARDLHEVLKLNTAAAIVLADHHVVNEDSLLEFKTKLRNIWSHAS